MWSNHKEDFMSNIYNPEDWYVFAFGNPEFVTTRANLIVPNLRPLNSKNIDYSLSFPNYTSSGESCSDGNFLSVGPPKSGYNNLIQFGGAIVPPGSNTPHPPDSRISVYNTKSGTSTNLAFCPTMGVDYTSTFLQNSAYTPASNTYFNLKDMTSENTGDHIGREYNLYFDGTNDPTSDGSVGFLLCYDGERGVTFKNPGIFEACKQSSQTCPTDFSECKWKNDAEIFGCCTTNTNDGQYTTAQLNQLCGTAFMPGTTEGSLCTDFMVKACENNWYSVCQEYLDNYKGNPDVGSVVNKTIKNYINNLGAKTCGNNDYTTPHIGNSCTYSLNGKQTARDDSQDPFFTKVIPDLCSTIADSENNCDVLLNQYCSQFTREDLNGDSVLQKLCGCHLQTSNCSSVPACTTDGGLNLHNPAILKNQYPYPGIGIECDAICATSSAIPSNTGKCKETVCIMNDTQINTINSQCGNITISQICKGAEGSSSICYMSDTGINTINSQCGKEFIEQSCGNCFKYDSKQPWVVKEVNCSNLSGAEDGGGSGGSSNLFGNFMSWIKSHPWYTTAIVLVVLILIFLIIYFGFF